jgi:hypothetical protein
MITIAQNKTAMVPGGTASFLADGGTAPYIYQVLPNGAGGTIDPLTGIYSAPAGVSVVPTEQYDVIQATDIFGAQGTTQILIGTPLDMLLDIIQTQIGLDPDHIYYYNEKGFMPTDEQLFIVLKIVNVKAYSNRRYSTGIGSGWDTSAQTLNSGALIDINIMSRSRSAILQKEQVLMALNSQYSQTQQQANGFKLPKIPMGFVDLSEQDGSAMLNRFVLSAMVLYSTTFSQANDYFDTFQVPQLVTQS